MFYITCTGMLCASGGMYSVVMDLCFSDFKKSAVKITITTILLPGKECKKYPCTNKMEMGPSFGEGNKSVFRKYSGGILVLAIQD